MSTPLRTVAALATVLLMASACGSATDEPGDGSPTPATTSTPAPGTSTAAPGTSTTGPTPSEAPSTGGGGALPADLRTRPEVAAAIADAASRQGVAPDQVVIAAWTPVTWNDGSLGCPQKGMAYTQALVDGELLMLRVEQSLFQYHSGRGGPFTYCANPDPSYAVTS